MTKIIKQMKIMISRVIKSNTKKIKESKTEKPTKVVKKDKLEVNYAKYPEKYNNIFKHIISIYNDSRKNNKTLKNIEEAIKSGLKDKADVIPELHVFVAARFR